MIPSRNPDYINVPIDLDGPEYNLLYTADGFEVQFSSNEIGFKGHEFRFLISNSSASGPGGAIPIYIKPRRCLAGYAFSYPTLLERDEVIGQEDPYLNSYRNLAQKFASFVSKHCEVASSDFDSNWSIFIISKHILSEQNVSNFVVSSSLLKQGLLPFWDSWFQSPKVTQLHSTPVDSFSLPLKVSYAPQIRGEAQIYRSDAHFVENKAKDLALLFILAGDQKEDLISRSILYYQSFEILMEQKFNELRDENLEPSPSKHQLSNFIRRYASDTSLIKSLFKEADPAILERAKIACESVLGPFKNAHEAIYSLRNDIVHNTRNFIINDDDYEPAITSLRQVALAVLA